jgi:tripartite-type tricarboxylate transporter receptor subunit TctC
MTIVARSNLAPTSLNDLITYVATQDGRTLFAHSGVGSASHLCGLLFMRAIGHKVTTVPYKSAGQSMNDLMGKQVDMTCDQTTNTTGPILSKAIKVYAITTTTRLASLQNVPTAGEAGLKGFELSVWHGVFAPAGLPPEIQRKLSQALVKSLQNAELGKRFRMINTEPVSEQEATPQQLHRLVLDEMDRWGPIIKDAGEFAD